MWDLSNQFVAVCLTGGLITLIVFIALLSSSFGGLGTARKRLAAAGNRKGEWLCWCLGCALLGHVVGWFGCSYMAQMQMTLFVLLAMISAAILTATKPPADRVEALGNSDVTSLPEPVEAWV
jgi:hypothetical protein